MLSSGLGRHCAQASPRGVLRLRPGLRGGEVADPCQHMQLRIGDRTRHLLAKPEWSDHIGITRDDQCGHRDLRDLRCAIATVQHRELLCLEDFGAEATGHRGGEGGHIGAGRRDGTTDQIHRLVEPAGLGQFDDADRALPAVGRCGDRGRVQQRQARDPPSRFERDVQRDVASHRDPGQVEPVRCLGEHVVRHGRDRGPAALNDHAFHEVVDPVDDRLPQPGIAAQSGHEDQRILEHGRLPFLSL